jgi:hypothetical protein
MATTWRRSFNFTFICRSFSFGFACHEVYVELVLLSRVVNYIVDLLLCIIIPVYSACFGGSTSGEAAKACSSKKTLIFIREAIFVG